MSREENVKVQMTEETMKRVKVCNVYWLSVSCRRNSCLTHLHRREVIEQRRSLVVDVSEQVLVLWRWSLIFFLFVSQSPEMVAAVGKLSYNQLVEKIIDYKHSADSSRVSEGNTHTDVCAATTEQTQILTSLYWFQ